MQFFQLFVLCLIFRHFFKNFGGAAVPQLLNPWMHNQDQFDLDSSDGREVRASASGAVNLGLIPSRVKPMTLKLVFTASLLDAQH